MVGDFTRMILFVTFVPFAVAIGLYIVLFLERQSDVINRVLKPLGFSLGAVIATLLFMSMIVTTFCLAIHPVEAFVDYGAQITAAEVRVCQLITRTDNFISGDIGSTGMIYNAEGDSIDTDEHRRLVSNAQMNARPALMTDCSQATYSEADDDNRLARLESTLGSFSGPHIQSAYDKSVRPCGTSAPESLGFVKKPVQARIDAILAEIDRQEKRLLAPLDEKVKQMQTGDLSDCDKRMGAHAMTKR